MVLFMQIVSVLRWVMQKQIEKKIEVTLFHSSVKNTLLIDNKDVFSQQTEFGEESKCH